MFFGSLKLIEFISNVAIIYDKYMKQFQHSTNFDFNTCKSN